MNKKILITGSAGFIGGYVVQAFLDDGWTVVGIDNYSKYGEIKKSYDNHPNYQFVRGDAKNTELLKELIEGCDQI
jgi:UDP-glucose 4-epimerase